MLVKSSSLFRILQTSRDADNIDAKITIFSETPKQTVEIPKKHLTHLRKYAVRSRPSKYSPLVRGPPGRSRLAELVLRRLGWC